LYHPAFFIGKSRNYAFDILAAFPKDIPQTIEVSSAFKTVCWAIANKLLPRLSIMNV